MRMIYIVFLMHVNVLLSAYGYIVDIITLYLYYTICR